MKGDPVPDADHVARYVGGSLVHDGRIDGNAFLRRRGEEAPSVHWLETLADDLAEQITELRLRSRLTPRPTAVFARLNVGRAGSVASEQDPEQRTLSFVHDPLDADPPRYPLDDPSHALIEGLPNPDDGPEAEALGDMIARTLLDTFPTMSPSLEAK